MAKYLTHPHIPKLTLNSPETEAGIHYDHLGGGDLDLSLYFYLSNCVM